MLLTSPPIPSIFITPAPPEPYSSIPSAKLDVDDDGYRAKWLSVPALANTFPWRSSPLRPIDGQPQKGLSPDQFDSLLNVSRDQRARLGKQKIPDLRKELALKNQRLKQLERRALFLSKVREPSFTAVPEVPLKSSTTAHCSIFGSEFSALEVAAENSEDVVFVDFPVNPGWNEQAERGRLIAKQPLTSSKFPAMPTKSRRVLPSLDEITARLKPAHVPSEIGCSRSRKHNFLKAPRLSPGSTDDQVKTIPVRSLAVNDEKFDTTTFAQHVTPSQYPNPPGLKLGSKHARSPRNVNVVAGSTVYISRAETARDMIVTLKRRNSPPPGLGHRECRQTSIAVKRRSAPAPL